MRTNKLFSPFDAIFNKLSIKTPEYAETIYHNITQARLLHINQADNKYFIQANTKCQECAREREIYILVVKFDHKKGSIIEYAIPKASIELFKQGSEIEKCIVFSALPDAAHTSEVLLTLE